MSNLQDVMLEAFSHYSDKSSKHNYHLIYSKTMPESVKNILEIGLSIDGSNGNSLNSWRIIYPDANVYGIDNQQHKLINDNEKIKCLLADQSSLDDLENVRKALKNVPFDVIIDDASHQYQLTINTFEKLFSLLGEGGVYFIEDVSSQGPHTDPNWSVDGLKKYFDDNKIKYEIYDNTSTNAPDSIIFVIRKQ
jgi:demethylmacrocin O-methyltransferase